MNLTQLIERLSDLRAEHGDLDVTVAAQLDNEWAQLVVTKAKVRRLAEIMHTEDTPDYTGTCVELT